MFLSKYILSFNDLKRMKFRDTYSIHKFVYSLFPQQDNSTRSFLFNDKGLEQDKRVILILSHEEPKTPEYGEIITKEINGNIFSNSRYIFQITVNPIIQTKNGNKPIINDKELLIWFKEKGLKHGFNLNENEFKINKKEVIVFEKDQKRCTFNKVIFSGFLNVINFEIFKQSFENGIGRGKAFGFGMLEIIPVNK